MNNIILTGFMATGKTRVGQLLAQALGWQFIDLDVQVENKIGMTIAEYFNRFGEDAFRDRESEAVQAVAGNLRQVVATGGGVVLRQKNIDRLRSSGVLICLSASEQTIADRTDGDKLRPLLNRPDRLQGIRDLLAAREVQYRQADFQVETDGKPVAEIVDEILELLTKKGCFHGANPGQPGSPKL